MGVDKLVKSVFYRKPDSSDDVREMMIASANYTTDLGFYPVQELIVTAGQKTSRKRRLDHLSLDEKMRRKKLKNREAAQTSRDRKKAYVTNLEDDIKLLQQENKILSKRVSILEEENSKLRNSDVTKCLASDVVCVSAAGPAVSTDPLQQGAALHRSSIAMERRQKQRLLLAATTWMLTWTCWTGLRGISTQGLLSTQTISKTSQTSSQTTSSTLNNRRKLIVPRRWWGPGGGKRAWRPPPSIII